MLTCVGPPTVFRPPENINPSVAELPNVSVPVFGKLVSLVTENAVELIVTLYGPAAAVSVPRETVWPSAKMTFCPEVVPLRDSVVAITRPLNVTPARAWPTAIGPA